MRPYLVGLVLAAACGLGACGGSTDTRVTGTDGTGGATSTGTGSVNTTGAVLPAGVVALPTFHMAAVMPPPPSIVDVGGTNASALLPPVTVALSTAAQAIDTARLTPDALTAQLQAAGSAPHATARAAIRIGAQAGATPQSSTVYTPAQIRAAYGLPPLPATGASLSQADATALGAGQTIYIVDAYDNPNAFADLNTFSTTFGLPTCSRSVVTAATSLPLAAAASACQLTIAYPNASGTTNGAPPAYDAGWSPEIALDVQWAHAMAPLARIVLLESASASLSDLLGAVLLANKMGPGVLSMSFGAGEGSWVASTDGYFTGAGMTYLASTGDSGAGVSWPAVSANVLAVGGTSLNFSGAAARSEAAWSGSGGGISAYEPMPAYQNGVSIAGGGSLRSRAVADVSFNADPNTGQYVVVTPPGGSAGWYIYGGTSISSPQWAGVLALINANRVAKGQPALGGVHASLYAQVAEVPGNYAVAFDDITSGADGSCATCSASTGYDQSTGWGTPNFASLLALLSGVQNLPPLPGATLPGAMEGIAYASQWAATDATHNALSYSISGAPAGLTVSAGGAIGWARPVAGTYAFTVTVRNTAGKTASGRVSLAVVPVPAAPTVPGGAILLKTGTALSRSLGVTAPANSGTLAYSLSGAPAGLTVTNAGVLSWGKAVAGNYSFSAIVSNSYGKTGTGKYTLTVIAETPPAFSGNFALTAVAGKAYSHAIAASDPNGSALTFALAGAPAGMTASSGALTWTKAVKGSYTFTVTARDALGLSTTARFTLTVS